MSNIKKVDVITKYFLPVAGGIEHNIAKTYSVLATKYGWNVTIHTTKDNYTEKNIYSDFEKLDNIKIIRYQWSKLGFLPKIDYNNADVIALHNFDIFPHFQIMIYVLLKKLFNKKRFALILTPHGGFNPNWPTFSFYQRIIKWIYTYSLGTILINLTVDGVRAVSPWEKGEEEKYIKIPKVKLIENGLEEVAYEDLDKLVSDKLKQDVKGWGKYVFTNCRLYPIKNMENMYKAFAMLPKHYLLIHIGAIQDNEYKNSLDELAKSLGIEKRIKFLGVVRGADKYYITKQAMMMIHLAWWESGCNVLREGMSQGLPLVTSNTYGIPGIVKDKVNGYTVSPSDWKSAGEALCFIDKNIDSIEIINMKNINRSSQSEITWGNVAKKMDTFYREILNKNL